MRLTITTFANIQKPFTHIQCQLDNKLLHLIYYAQLIFHNLYLEMCVLIQQTNYTHFLKFFKAQLGLMEMEHDLI